MSITKMCSIDMVYAVSSFVSKYCCAAANCSVHANVGSCVFLTFALREYCLVE